VQVIRLPQGTQEEVDRVVALKVSELVDAAIVAPEPLQPAPATPRPAASTTSYDLLLEVGATVAAGGGGDQLGPVIVAGGGLAHGTLAAEATLFWRARSDLEASAAVGRVAVDDRSVGIGLRGLLRAGSLAGGVYAEGAARVVEAEGVALDGRSGSARRIIPTWAAGADGRWSLTRRLELRVVAGVEGAFTRHRFAVDRMPVLDLGVLRPTAQLSFVISLP
jgi:hypothetical protein